MHPFEATKDQPEGGQLSQAEILVVGGGVSCDVGGFVYPCLVGTDDSEGLDEGCPEGCALGAIDSEGLVEG